jgi:pimeloyl-ACP methyl ester carboxylesterase
VTMPPVTVAAAKLGRHPLARFLLSDLPEGVTVEPINVVAEDGAASTGLLYLPPGRRPTTVVHLMHPRTDQSQHYAAPYLLRAGFGVLGRAGRWVNNDVVTQHEQLVLDVAAGMRFLREERGFERVVGLGNSGGGALAAFYQSQAETDPAQRIVATPAGDPVRLDEADLPPMDGLVFLAAHPGQGAFLMRGVDPSVVDEGDLLAVESRLDMYDQRNGFVEPPGASSYTPDFIQAYRAAQVARVQRLDALARSRVEIRRDAERMAADPAFQRIGAGSRERLWRRAAAGWYMVVYRTSADLRFTDLSIEPDDRVVSSMFTDRPHVDNYSEHGFAHYLTPEAWLSTWSGRSSRASLAQSIDSITVPSLVVHYAGDAGISVDESQGLHDGLASTDKDYSVVRHATHYGMRIVDGRVTNERVLDGLDVITDWLQGRFAP